MKLISILLVIGFMIPVFDPWTPLVLLLITLGSLSLLGGIPLQYMLKILLPFSLFAFSFIWIGVVFPKEPGDTILFQIAGIPVALENAVVGLSLGLRSLVFAAWSLLFVLTTEPTRFMLSLIQHLRLPPRFGYGMMAAYRLLPLFRDELNQVRAAHLIRGFGEPRGMKEQWKELQRYTIPLLASAIRKAERVAIAMESKGFDGSRNRSYYHTVRWTKYDFLFGVGLILLYLGLIIFR